MNSVTSSFNRLRNWDAMAALDLWVWGPKTVRTEYGYTAVKRINGTGPKQWSRVTLVTLIAIGTVFAIGAGFVWIIDNRTHWLWVIGGIPILHWLIWTLWPVRRANANAD